MPVVSELRSGNPRQSGWAELSIARRRSWLRQEFLTNVFDRVLI